MFPTSFPDDDPPPVAPEPPGDNECCGSGCDPCVHDLFNAERERYFAALRAWKARQARRTAEDGAAD